MSKGHQGKGPATGARGAVQQVQAMATSLDAATFLKQLNLEASKPLIENIENKRQSRVLSLAYNESIGAQLQPTVIGALEHILRSLGHVPRLDLFLISTGGMAEVPYRIVSLLREFADSLGIIVPRMALSGATHIAIAGDELVMTPFSCLGSVDPKRMHPLLPPDKDGNPIPTSVQELKHCVEFISDQLGDESTSHDLALIIGELFQHINPLAIGAMEQSYHLSRLITEKVLRKRKEPLEDEHIKKIVDALAGKYFSHSFLISRTDVETDLGLTVTRPDDASERHI